LFTVHGKGRKLHVGVGRFQSYDLGREGGEIYGNLEREGEERCEPLAWGGAVLF